MGNIKNQTGMTIIELLIATVVIGFLIVPTMVVTIYFYGETLKNNAESKLAVESQNILRSIVEELRVASGIRATNQIADANSPGGGWSTSDTSLVLIISTPVLNSSNDYIIDPLTGYPYQNELVYHASGGLLYKRYLANTSAVGNLFKTSCPANLATATCPADAVLSKNFKDLSFIFYDQDDNVTTVLSEARSIFMQIDMEQKIYGRTITFENKIRTTLRNSLP